jgi:hypothetical protein
VGCMHVASWPALCLQNTAEGKRAWAVIEAVMEARQGRLVWAAAQAGRAEELSMLLQAATDLDWANAVSWAVLCSLLLVALKLGTVCACRRGRQRCGLQPVRAMHPAWSCWWALVLQWTRLTRCVQAFPPPCYLGAPVSAALRTLHHPPPPPLSPP